MNEQKQIELRLLAICIRGKTNPIDFGLELDDFTAKQHKTIYETLSQDKFSIADIPSIGEYSLELARELSDLRTQVMQSDDLPSLAYRLRENRITRESSQVIEQLKSEHAGSEFIDLAMNNLDKIRSASFQHYVDIPEVCDRVVTRVNGVRSGEIKNVGVPSGIEDLDNILTFNGVALKQVTVLAGATSAGKSALANTFKLNALRHKMSVIDCAYEDSPEAVIFRAVSSITGISNTRLQRGIVYDEEREHFEEVIEKLRKTQLRFLEQIPRSIHEMTARIKQMCKSQHTDLVIIDYLQLLSSGQKSRSRQEDIDYIMNEIVRMAKSIDAATILVSQLKRTNNRKPTKEDLYHSGSIEQHAHTIGLLWRPEIENYTDICMLIIDKQKNGKTGWVPLGWDAKTVKYIDPDAARAVAYEQAVKNLNRREN